MRGWVVAMYVAGLGAAIFLGECVGWLAPYLAHAGVPWSFAASMFCAAMAATAYVAGFRYLTLTHHNA